MAGFCMLLSSPCIDFDSPIRYSGNVQGSQGEAIRLFVRKMVYPRWKGEFCKANTIEQKSKLLPGGPHRQRSSQEPQNKQPDTVKRSLENIVVSGFRIVDLEFLLL